MIDLKKLKEDIEYCKELTGTYNSDVPEYYEAMDRIWDALEALLKVLRAAQGLCHGTDWNEGTHAKLHGYRQKLIDAVQDFDRWEKEAKP